VKRDSFNFSDIDRKMNFIIKANPNALIFPRVYLFSPPWWNEENPDELMRYHDGSFSKPIRWMREGTRYPSWASEKWREDAAFCLRQLIRHIKSQPYAKNVVGYHLASGGTDEWYYYPNYEWFDGSTAIYNYLDYSKPQNEAFRRWLKTKYKTVSALRSAWNSDSVTFESAQIAPKKDKSKTDFFVFYDPAKSQNVIDSYDFEAEIIAETIAYFCKVVKDETNGEAFTGCATHKLLQCDDLDFLTSPTSYQFREPGTGHSAFRAPVRSVQLHNKLWWDENDYRTFLTPPSGWLYNYAYNYYDTEMTQLRQLANQITHASAGWWFDMTSGWFDSSEMMQMIDKLNRIAENSVRFDRSSVAEIAVVVDEKSLLYLENGGHLYRPLIMDQRLSAGKVGAPVDWILLDDLDIAPDYKMIVFLNAFYVNKRQKQAIDRLEQRGTKAIVWVYAPGFIGKTLDVEGCKDLTGLDLKLLKARGPLKVTINSGYEKTLSENRTAKTYGTNNIIGPVIVGNDTLAKVLGTLDGFGEAGLITKKVNNIQTYFSVAPTLPEWLLRDIAVEAGVHIYNYQNNAMYVNKSFIGIHTAEAGNQTIYLENAHDIYDVYNDSVIARDVLQFNVELKGRYTGLYFLGRKKEWDIE